MDPLVDRIVRKIVEAIHPDKVILFGSRAQGTSDGDSDIDLVIVYSGPRSKRDVQVHIHKLFSHPDFSLDVFVLTPEELEAQRGVANSLAREVAERGLTCYG